MDKFLIPLSFAKRRAPLRAKVQADAQRMYEHARYVIVLDGTGNVLEARPNRRQDDNVIDCLAVFAPVTYLGSDFDKSVVLEIGFRRFVPYAQTEYSLNSSTKRGSRLRRRKGDMREAISALRKPRRDRTLRLTIPARVPVTCLSDDALFDLLPTITEGAQRCVDDIALTWEKTLGYSIRWARGGNRMTGIFLMKHELAPCLSVRIPSEIKLLCATAAFAEMEWRKQPGHHLEKRADAIKDMLKSFLRPKRQRGKNGDGDFEDDFVRASETCHWVSDRLRKIIEHGYSPAMVEVMLDFVGPPESVARKLVEQIWRVYKIPHPKRDQEFEAFRFKYGELKDFLLERWHITNYRNLRLERIREDEYVVTKDGQKRKKNYFHAATSYTFTVFVSKDCQAKMTEAYCARKEQEAKTNSVQPVQPISMVDSSPEEEDEIPWDTPHGKLKTGTDDDIPF